MKKKLLLIDDELDLLEIMNETLTRYGHEVECFTNAVQGLRKFYDDPTEVSCIIVDYQIPIMTGVELALQMMEISPSIPIIITTGFADEHIERLLSNHKNVYLLEKPFRLDELVFLLNQIVKRPHLRVSA
jgi:DNA-binding NtrC family response regulator